MTATTVTSNNASAPPRPAGLAVNPDGIPAELKHHRRWVGWRYALRNNKWTKPPVNAVTGGNADSTVPATWSDYETALDYYRNHRGDEQCPCDGIGFVLGDGFAGIDFDDCLNGDGSLKEWAAPLVTIVDSYTEVS